MIYTDMYLFIKRGGCGDSRWADEPRTSPIIFQKFDAPRHSRPLPFKFSFGADLVLINVCLRSSSGKNWMREIVNSLAASQPLYTNSGSGFVAGMFVFRRPSAYYIIIILSSK